MTDHVLKVQIPFYHALRREDKTFEARKDDRDYAVKDRLILVPWDADDSRFVFEPGMEPLIRLITHKQTFGFIDGYCGLSLKSLGQVPSGDVAWVKEWLGHMPWCDCKHGPDLSCAGHLSSNFPEAKE